MVPTKISRALITDHACCKIFRSPTSDRSHRSSPSLRKHQHTFHLNTSINGPTLIFFFPSKIPPPTKPPSKPNSFNSTLPPYSQHHNNHKPMTKTTTHPSHHSLNPKSPFSQTSKVDYRPAIILCARRRPNPSSSGRIAFITYNVFAFPLPPPISIPPSLHLSPSSQFLMPNS